MKYVSVSQRAILGYKGSPGWVQGCREGHPVTDSLDAVFDGYGPLLSAPEVAQLLGMTKQGVYHWLREGVIPGYKLGTTWFISVEELKAELRRGANPRDRKTSEIDAEAGEEEG